jgi:hypothetical protein
LGITSGQGLSSSPRVLYHESGHADMAHRLRFRPYIVSAIREGERAGHCRWDPRADSPWDHYAHAVILFGGPEAERQHVGTPEAILRAGMEEDVNAAVPHLQAVASAWGWTLEDVVRNVAGATRILVTEDAEAIRALADVLARLPEPLLEGDRLTAFLREVEVPPAARACSECGRECPCAATREARDRILARQAGGAA